MSSHSNTTATVKEMAAKGTATWHSDQHLRWAASIVAACEKADRHPCDQQQQSDGNAHIDGICGQRSHRR